MKHFMKQSEDSELLIQEFRELERIANSKKHKIGNDILKNF